MSEAALQKLRALELALTDLPRDFLEPAAREIRDWTAQQIQLQFATGTDLYGRPWPLAKDGHRPKMVRSGDLRSGYRYSLTQTGTGYRLQISNVMPYAGYLQAGTSNMQARTHVPRTFLPPKWAEGYKRIHEKHFERWVQSVRLR